MFLDIIDRRKNPKDKSLINRQRFLRRHAGEVRDAVRQKIRETAVGDIASNDPKRVSVPSAGTEEPVFRHGDGGVVERVLPGNKEYRAGDTIPRPKKGSGDGGSEGAPEGESSDGFVFEITHEEFLSYFFEGLELPDMVKRALAGEDQFKLQRAGFASEGTPNNLDPLRTLRQSHARRLAFRIPKLRRKHKLEEERDRLEVCDRLEECDRLEAELARDTDASRAAQRRARIAEIEGQIRTLERQIKAIPFLDDVDVRYRRHEKVPVPISQAVMFCLMDVSASMGEWEKEMAKRFFMLLYLFLTRSYERVEVVFIRHHHSAKEVDEEEFFKSPESGGTVVSTALSLMGEIVDSRYAPSQWNIYACQASDGDNFKQDLPVAHDLMVNTIMPLVQYFAYVEVDEKQDSELWPTYETIRASFENFAMARITDAKDIFPVFRGLFEKTGAAHVA